MYAITLKAIRDTARKRASRLDRPCGDPDSARAAEGHTPLLRVADADSRTPEEIAITR